MNIVWWVWNLFPWYMQAGFIGYVAFTSIGGTIQLYGVTKKFAGKWSIPAMASLIIPIGLWLYSFIRKEKPSPIQHEHLPAGHRDAAPSVDKPRFPFPPTSL